MTAFSTDVCLTRLVYLSKELQERGLVPGPVLSLWYAANFGFQSY